MTFHNNYFLNFFEALTNILFFLFGLKLIIIQRRVIFSFLVIFAKQTFWDKNKNKICWQPPLVLKI
jgi:hypothetical protein